MRPGDGGAPCHRCGAATRDDADRFDLCMPDPHLPCLLYKPAAQLEPCPFCGAEPMRTVAPAPAGIDGALPTLTIECAQCGIPHVTGDDFAAVAAAWNTRTR